MTRPYVGKTIVELEAIFAAGKSDPAELKRLSEELKHRHVPKAVSLLAKVKASAGGSSTKQEPPKQSSSDVARPYIGKTIVELEGIFAVGATDPRELQLLAEELAHRKLPKAVSLLAKVKAAVADPGAGQETRSDDNGTHKKASSSSEEPTHKTVPCKVCTKPMRVPLTTGTFNCPSCKTEFKAAFEDGVFSLLFANPAKENPQSTGDRQMTLADAYALFEASDATPWEAIEGKRRKLLQQYHPDKVASLGSKLRAVAAVEGKRINIAYALVRQARGC